jgi:hypothetical protein
MKRPLFLLSFSAGLLLTCMAVILLVTRSAGPVGQSEISVRLADLSPPRKVIGSLGHPLGTVVTIAGQWKSGDRPAIDKEFVVTRVNGVSLLSPCVFERHDMELILSTGGPAPFEDGAIYMLRGYESGTFSGVPLAVFEELGSALPAAHSTFRFESRFTYFQWKRVSE